LEQVERRIAEAMVRRIIVIGSIMGFIAYGLATVSLCRSSLFDDTRFTAALVGFAAGAVIWLILGRRLVFFSVFEHELTHLVFSIFMFQKPRSFYASERRGHVSCDRGNFIDGLAPYYFPTFSYLLLALYPLLRPSAYMVFFPALGLTTGYHFVSNIGEFKPSESDIRRYGVGFSFVFCLFAGTLTLGFLLAFTAGGFGGAITFIKAGWHQAGGITVYLLKYVWAAISHLLSPSPAG
jgi:hypothetical protein